MVRLPAQAVRGVAQFPAQAVRLVIPARSVPSEASKAVRTLVVVAALAAAARLLRMVGQGVLGLDIRRARRAALLPGRKRAAALVLARCSDKAAQVAAAVRQAVRQRRPLMVQAAVGPAAKRPRVRTAAMGAPAIVW